MQKIYSVIQAITAELAKVGIAKDRKNEVQGYKFRGIDDVYGALAPLLAKHGLCILPKFASRTVTEQQTKNGGMLFHVTVEGQFEFVATEDGSRHIVCTFGEAMDSGDKATNKAMSAAYKYAAFQAFCIPTEGDNDADATTVEVAAGMPDPLEASHTANIDEAENIEGLKVAWVAAVKAAGQDQKAIARMESHKDARKKALAVAK